MASSFLHERKDFKTLCELTSQEQKMEEPSLVEKDYWIMHCLWGVAQAGLKFELKGGTSLSKGFGVIHRFSEDIDIRIEPDEKLLGIKVYSGKNHDKEQHRNSRADFFNGLAKFLSKKIPGIISVERDTPFDDVPRYRNGGLRLRYETVFDPVEGIKEGVLLEVGFDQTAPNVARDISSWAYERARQAKGIEVVDNRALGVRCYDYRYTFVEKLQTVVRKHRIYKSDGKLPTNFLRHYYDIFHLINLKDVQEFIGTDDYKAHKENRFGSDDTKVSNSGALKLEDEADRKAFLGSYEKTKALYYNDMPDLGQILERIKPFLHKL